MKTYILEMQSFLDSYEWEIVSIDTNYKRIREIADRIVHVNYRISTFEKGKRVGKKYYVWDDLCEDHSEYKSDEKHIFDVENHFIS